jgi:toxin ParE1/3/4
MAKAAEVWRVDVTGTADKDIEEIYRWTEQRFGAAQADAYADAIANAIVALKASPRVRGAHPRPDIQTELYTLHLSRFRRRARHFVVFRINDAGRRVIGVLRVLHDAMDLARHLPADDEEKGASDDR